MTIVEFWPDYDGALLWDESGERVPLAELSLPPDGMPIADMLVAVKLASSKSEAMRLLKSGGVYVNNARVADERARLTPADAIGGAVFVLRKGRKDQHLVRVRS